MGEIEESGSRLACVGRTVCPGRAGFTRRSREKEKWKMVAMNGSLQQITGVVISVSGMGDLLCLSLKGREGELYPVASASWHVDYDGYITHPATGDYRDEWLPDVAYGNCLTGKRVRQVVADWLSRADLSPLDDPDDDTGHKALTESLWGAIQGAQAA
jgi:hypothetical protein